MLQARERVSGLQAQLGREQQADALVGLERIRLATGAVQGEHQLAPHPLLELVPGGEALELGQQVTRAAGGEVGVHAQEDRLQPLLLERPAPLRHAPLRGDIAQRIPAEQAERLTQQHRGMVRLASRLFDECVEAPDVDLEAPRAE